MSFTVVDCTGLHELTLEQVQELQQAKEASCNALKANNSQRAAAAYRFPKVPRAKLSSGHSIPLIGLGTW
jgi:hypothetical protein